MLIALLLSVLAIATGAPTGTIEGRITPPDKVNITKPVQVVVFAGPYANLYRTELQLRVDNYWEDYKLAFIQDKEAFVLFRDRAERQAMEVTLNRMRKDEPLAVANFVRMTSNNSFDFRMVPQGECWVVALVKVGNQEFIWSESVILTDQSPALVLLKPANP